MDLDHSLWSKVEGSREMIRRSGTAFMWMKVHSLSIYPPRREADSGYYQRKLGPNSEIEKQLYMTTL